MKSTKKIAIAKTSNVVAKTETAPVITGSVFIAECAKYGVLPASGDGLQCRETFRNAMRKLNAWQNGVTTWGRHAYMTDLHQWCVARMIDRLGDRASPDAAKYRDTVFRRIPRDALENAAHWDVDVGAHRAAYVGAVAKSATTKRATRKSA